MLDHLFYITSYFWAGFPISEVPKCGHPLQLCFWMACSLSSLAKPGSQNAGMKRLPIAIPSIPSPHHSGGGSTVIFFNGVSLSKHLTNRPACGHPRLRHTHHVTSWELTITAWEDGLPGNLPLLCRPPPQLPISTLLGEVDWTHLASPTQVLFLTKTTLEKNRFFNPSFLLRLHMAFAESYSGVAVLPSTAWESPCCATSFRSWQISCRGSQRWNVMGMRWYADDFPNTISR